MRRNCRRDRRYSRHLHDALAVRAWRAGVAQVVLKRSPGTESSHSTSRPDSRASRFCRYRMEFTGVKKNSRRVVCRPRTRGDRTAEDTRRAPSPVPLMAAGHREDVSTVCWTYRYRRTASSGRPHRAACQPGLQRAPTCRGFGVVHGDRASRAASNTCRYAAPAVSSHRQHLRCAARTDRVRCNRRSSGFIRTG